MMISTIHHQPVCVPVFWLVVNVVCRYELILVPLGHTSGLQGILHLREPDEDL